MKVCVYKLEPADDGKTTAELVRRSLCHYPEMMNVNLPFPTFKTCACTVTRIDVESVATAYGKRSGNCNDTSARAPAVYVKSIEEACIPTSG